jgi:hypothetical protein
MSDPNPSNLCAEHINYSTTIYTMEENNFELLAMNLNLPNHWSVVVSII